MLPKEIMLRTGTRTKANASDVGASPPCASSVTFAKKLLNPGSLSLLLKVLAHLADCPRSRIPGAARGPSLSTAARGVSGGVAHTLSCGVWLIPGDSSGGRAGDSPGGRAVD